MLPPAPPWTATDARAWARASWHPWLRYAVVAAWVGSVAAAVIGDTHPCTVAHPCGPDLSFAYAIVLLFASVVLLWWRPVLACLAGVGFGVLEVLYDEVQSARVAFTGFGLLCAALALYIDASRRRQRLLVDRAGARRLSLPPGVRPAPSRRDAPVHAAGQMVEDLVLSDAAGVVHRLDAHWARRLAAGLLALGAAGAWAWYDHQVDEERQHLSRAVEVQARVGGPGSDEFTQRLEVLDPLPGRPTQVEIEPLEDLERGSVHPLLLDPSDPDWARLVAEPADSTPWASLGLGLAALAGLLVLREVEVRRARSQLSAGEHPALAVRALRTPDGDCLVLAADAALAVARFACDPPPDHHARQHSSPAPAAPAPEAGHDVDTASPVEDAVLLGDLRERGWAALLTATGVVMPQGPLTVFREPLVVDPDELSAEPDEDQSPPGVEVVHGDTLALPELPLVLQGSRWDRLLGAGFVAASVVGAPLFVWQGAQSLWEVVPALAVGAGLLRNGVERGWSALRLTRPGVEVHTGFTSMFLPWSVFDEVRVDGERVYLIGNEDDLELCAYGDEPLRSERLRRTEELALGLRHVIDIAGGPRPEKQRTRRRVAAGGYAAGLFATGVVGGAVARFLL